MRERSYQSWQFQRLETLLQVIYLVFNEGYSASSGESVTRADLSGEAIRLGHLLMELLPEPEVVGLVALMLLQENATVTICHSRTADLPAMCRQADVLVAAIGRTAFVTRSTAEARSIRSVSSMALVPVLPVFSHCLK